MFGYNPYQFGIDSNTLPVLQNLVSWHDAADFLTLSLRTSGPDRFVTNWADKSGNGHNAAQTNTTDQPLFSEGGINGLDALDFVSLDSMTLGSVIMDGIPVNGRTFFVVLNADTTNSAILTLASNTTAGTVYNITPLTALAVSGGNFIWIEAMTAANRVFTLITIAEATPAVENSLGWRDGIIMTESSSVPEPINTGSSGTTRFGESSNGAQHYNGKIGEVITYDRELSDSERESVENYLGVKWRITITH